MEKAKSTRKLFASNADSSIKVFGFNNFVYLQKGQSVAIISGDMSKLTDIQAVALSPDGNVVATLDRYPDKNGNFAQQLLFFKSSQNGNVVPFAVNNESIISDAQSVTFGSQAGEVLIPVARQNKISNKIESEIISFLISGDSRSPVLGNRPQKREVLSSATAGLFNANSVIAKESEIVVLDPTAGLQAFSLTKDSSKRLWEIKSSDPLFKNLRDLSHLTYSRDKKTLFIFDSSGNFTRLAY